MVSENVNKMFKLAEFDTVFCKNPFTKEDLFRFSMSFKIEDDPTELSCISMCRLNPKEMIATLRSSADVLEQQLERLRDDDGWA